MRRFLAKLKKKLQMQNFLMYILDALTLFQLLINIYYILNVLDVIYTM